MFALTILGAILLVALIIAFARRSRESKMDCGSIQPCLGSLSKREKSMV
jgi:hypothetical protein